MIRLVIFICSIQVTWASTYLSPSVSIFNDYDLKNCQEQLDQVKSLGSKSVSLTINIWAIMEKGTVKSFCHRKKHNCVKFDQKGALSYAQGIKNCIQRASDLDLQVTILPHIDDHNGAHWRNNIIFDPIKKYGGYSYNQLLLRPSAEQLYLGHKKSFLNLAGEMGASFFSYPSSYHALIPKYKKHKTQVGIGLNYNTIWGSLRRRDINKNRSRQALLAMDFIGISAYKGVTNRSPLHFEDTLWDFTKEVKSLKIKLPPSTQYHFSEVGIGGGSRVNDGKTRALNYSQTMESPYSGINSSQYQESSDPWLIAQNYKAREVFYQYLFAYLKSKTKKFNLTYAYLWNVGSWDFLGVYPATRFYQDEALTKKFINYNRSF